MRSSTAVHWQIATATAAALLLLPAALATCFGCSPLPAPSYGQGDSVSVASCYGGTLLWRDRNARLDYASCACTDGTFILRTDRVCENNVSAPSSCVTRLGSALPDTTLCTTH